MSLSTLLMKVGLDSRAWDVGMKKLHASTTNWARSTAKTFAGQIAGMMAIESIASGIHGMYVGAEETLDAAIRYDTTTDNIQKLSAAAAKARMPVDRLMDAIKDLSVKQNDAVNGSKTWMETLSRYGFTMEDLQRNSPVEMFQALSKAVSESQMKVGALAADMDDLMSDPGHELFPAMRRGLFNDLGEMPVTFTRPQLENMAQTSAQGRSLMNQTKAEFAQYTQNQLPNTLPGVAFRIGRALGGMVFGQNPQSTAAKEQREMTDSANLQAIADGVNKMSQ